MDDTVALAATLGGTAVGLAGIGVTAWSVRQQRKQALELAESQHEHEQRIASGNRLFDRRADAYEAMIGSAHALMEHVEATEPFVTYSGERPLPPEPSPDVQRAMQAKARTIGSQAVADALDLFTQDVRSFFVQAQIVAAIRASGVDMGDELEKTHEARKRARKAMEKLERLVSDELASL